MLSASSLLQPYRFNIAGSRTVSTLLRNVIKSLVYVRVEASQSRERIPALQPFCRCGRYNFLFPESDLSRQCFQSFHTLKKQELISPAASPHTAMRQFSSTVASGIIKNVMPNTKKIRKICSITWVIAGIFASCIP